jgi:hypothetical protein
MSKKAESVEEQGTKTAFVAFDFVIDSIIYIITILIVSLFSFNPLLGKSIGDLITKYKYHVVIGILMTILSIIMLISSQGTATQNIPTGRIGSIEETSLEGINAKVLSVPYFNQWLEPDGSNAPTKIVSGGFELGRVICGAASSTMIAGYYSKLAYNLENEHSLKAYSFEDMNLNLPTKCNDNTIRGAFGMTAYDRLCNQSYALGIQLYFKKLNIQSSIEYRSPNFREIKEQIDQGFPLVVSISTFEGFGHLAVIKGYTEDGRFVMNDPWTDVQSGNRAYSYKGKNAIYLPDLGEQGDFKYFIKTNV